MGESYAGVYIPTTALALLEGGLCAGTPAFPTEQGKQLNYQGSAIGNGCTGTDEGPCSPSRSLNTYHQLATQGLVSASTHATVQVRTVGHQASAKQNARISVWTPVKMKGHDYLIAPSTKRETCFSLRLHRLCAVCAV
jgi:carboxypeptidase C (cathepsin A)